MVFEAAFQAGGFQPLADLRPGAVDQDQPHAQAVQQGNIVNDIGEIRVQCRLAAEDDDKSALSIFKQRKVNYHDVLLVDDNIFNCVAV